VMIYQDVVHLLSVAITAYRIGRNAADFSRNEQISLDHRAAGFTAPQE